MAKMCGFNGSYIIRQNSAKFVRDSLNAIGVPNEQIIEVPPTHWEAERMWMPSSVPACTMIHNPEVLTELRKQILAACSSTPTSISSKRIYLSRRNPKRPRRVLNEDQLASILKSFEFEIVDTEKMTFSEQVAMISQAEFLIGPSGAGMIHSLFLPEGSTVLELFPADYINPVGFKPSKLLNHRYYMVSNNLNQEILSDPGNIVANLEIIEHMLKMDLSRTPYSA